MDFRQFLVWGWKSKIQMENSTSCVYILTTQADDAPQNEAWKWRMECSHPGWRFSNPLCYLEPSISATRYIFKCFKRINSLYSSCILTKYANQVQDAHTEQWHHVIRSTDLYAASFSSEYVRYSHLSPAQLTEALQRHRRWFSICRLCVMLKSQLLRVSPAESDRKSVV